MREIYYHIITGLSDSLLRSAAKLSRKGIRSHIRRNPDDDDFDPFSDLGESDTDSLQDKAMAIVSALEGLGYWHFIQAEIISNKINSNSDEFFKDIKDFILGFNWDEVSKDNLNFVRSEIEKLLISTSPICGCNLDHVIPKIFYCAPKSYFKCPHCNSITPLIDFLDIESKKPVFPMPIPESLIKLVEKWCSSKGFNFKAIGTKGNLNPELKIIVTSEVDPPENVVTKEEVEEAEEVVKEAVNDVVKIEIEGLDTGLDDYSSDIKDILGETEDYQQDEEEGEDKSDSEQDSESESEEFESEGSVSGDSKKEQDAIEELADILVNTAKLPESNNPNQYRGINQTGETEILGKEFKGGIIVAKLDLGIIDIETGHVKKHQDGSPKLTQITRYDKKTKKLVTKVGPIPEPSGNPKSQYEWQDLALERWVTADNGWRLYPGKEYNGIVEACTGSGKTKFAIKCIDRLLKDKDKSYGKGNEDISITIICPPLKEVHGQWYCEIQDSKTFSDLNIDKPFDNKDIAIFGGDIGYVPSENEKDLPVRKKINIYIINTASGKGKTQPKTSEDKTEKNISEDQSDSEDGQSEKVDELISNLLERHLKEVKDKNQKHFLIVDEVHRASPRAKRFTKIFDCKIDYSLLITGTMIKGWYWEVFCADCSRCNKCKKTARELFITKKQEICSSCNGRIIYKEDLITSGGRGYESNGFKVRRNKEEDTVSITCVTQSGKKKIRNEEHMVINITNNGLEGGQDTFLSYFVNKTGPLVAFYSYPEALWKKNIAHFRLWFVEASNESDEEVKKSIQKAVAEAVLLQDIQNIDTLPEIEQAMINSAVEVLGKARSQVSRVRLHELARIIQFCIEKGMKVMTFNRLTKPLKVIHRYLITALKKVYDNNEAKARKQLALNHSLMAGSYFNPEFSKYTMPVMQKFRAEPLYANSLRYLRSNKSEDELISIPAPQIYAKLAENVEEGSQEILIELDDSKNADSNKKIMDGIIKSIINGVVTGIGTNFSILEPGQIIGSETSGFVRISKIINNSEIQYDKPRDNWINGYIEGLSDYEINKKSQNDITDVYKTRATFGYPIDIFPAFGKVVIGKQLSKAEKKYSDAKNQPHSFYSSYKIVGDYAEGKLKLIRKSRSGGPDTDIATDSYFKKGTPVVMEQHPAASGTPRDLRQMYMEQFRVPTGSGDSSAYLPVMISGKGLVEGVDVPDADVGVCLAPLAKDNEIPNLQSLGRILRIKRLQDGSIAKKDYILFFDPGNSESKSTEKNAVILFEKYLKLDMGYGPQWVTEEEPWRGSYLDFFRAFSEKHGDIPTTYTGGTIEYVKAKGVSKQQFIILKLAGNNDWENKLKSGYKVILRYASFSMILHISKVSSSALSLGYLPPPNIKSEDGKDIVKFINEWNLSTDRRFIIEKDFKIDKKIADSLIIESVAKLTMGAYKNIAPLEYRDMGIYIKEIKAQFEGFLLSAYSTNKVPKKCICCNEKTEFYDEKEEKKTPMTHPEYLQHIKETETDRILKEKYAFIKSAESKIAKERLNELHNPDVIMAARNVPKCDKELKRQLFCEFRKARQTGNSKLLSELYEKCKQNKLPQKLLEQVEGVFYIPVCYDDKTSGINKCDPKSRTIKYPQEESGKIIGWDNLDPNRPGRRGQPQKWQINLNEAIKASVKIVKGSEETTGCYIVDTLGNIYDISGNKIAPRPEEAYGKFIVSCGAYIKTHFSLEAAVKDSLINAIGGCPCEIRTVVVSPNGEVIPVVLGKVKPAEVVNILSRPKPNKFSLWKDAFFTIPLKKKGKKQVFSTQEAAFKTAAKYQKVMLSKGKSIVDSLCFIKGDIKNLSNKSYTLWLDPYFQYPLFGVMNNDISQLGFDDQIEVISRGVSEASSFSSGVFIKGLPFEFYLFKDKECKQTFIKNGKPISGKTLKSAMATIENYLSNRPSNKIYLFSVKDSKITEFSLINDKVSESVINKPSISPETSLKTKPAKIAKSVKITKIAESAISKSHIYRYFYDKEMNRPITIKGKSIIANIENRDRIEAHLKKNVKKDEFWMEFNGKLSSIKTEKD